MLIRAKTPRCQDIAVRFKAAIETLVKASTVRLLTPTEVSLTCVLESVQCVDRMSGVCKWCTWRFEALLQSLPAPYLRQAVPAGCIMSPCTDAEVFILLKVRLLRLFCCQLRSMCRLSLIDSRLRLFCCQLRSMCRLSLIDFRA